jgi:hypothetical protein
MSGGELAVCVNKKVASDIICKVHWLRIRSTFATLSTFHERFSIYVFNKPSDFSTIH